MISDLRNLPVGHTLSLHDRLPFCSPVAKPSSEMDRLWMRVRDIERCSSGGRLSACIPNDERRPTVSTSRRARRSGCVASAGEDFRSEEHTSELPSPMRQSYAGFRLKKKKKTHERDEQYKKN